MILTEDYNFIPFKTLVFKIRPKEIFFVFDLYFVCDKLVQFSQRTVKLRK